MTRSIYLVAISALWAASIAPLLRAQSDLFAYSVSRTVAGSAPLAVDFSVAGRELGFVTQDGEVRLAPLDRDGERSLARGSWPGPVLALGRAARLVLVGSKNGSADLLFTDGSPLHELLKQHSPVTAVAISPNEELVAVAAEHAVILWSTRADGELLRLAVPEKKPLKFLAFAGSEARLVAVTEAGAILEWDVSSRSLLRQMHDPDAEVLSADLNPAGTMLALATETSGLPSGNPMRPAHPADFHRDNRIKIYNLEKGALAKQIEGIDGELRGMSLSADGRFLAAARQRPRDTFLSVYDLQRGVEIASIPALPGSTIARFSPDGRWLAAAALDGKLTVYSVTGTRRSAQPGDLAGVKILVTSAERKPLLIPETPIVVAVMDLESLEGDAATGRALSDMLRNRLAGVKNVQLVERDKMRRVIAEQNFQNTNRTDSATAVQLGRILNARKMIFGTVGLLGDTYTINVRMIDVETDGVDGIREVLCQRCTMNDLPDAIAELAAALEGSAQ